MLELGPTNSNSTPTIMGIASHRDIFRYLARYFLNTRDLSRLAQVNKFFKQWLEDETMGIEKLKYSLPFLFNHPLFNLSIVSPSAWLFSRGMNYNLEFKKIFFWKKTTKVTYYNRYMTTSWNMAFLYSYILSSRILQFVAKICLSNKICRLFPVQLKGKIPTYLIIACFDGNLNTIRNSSYSGEIKLCLYTIAAACGHHQKLHALGYPFDPIAAFTLATSLHDDEQALAILTQHLNVFGAQNNEDLMNDLLLSIKLHCNKSAKFILEKFPPLMVPFKINVLTEAISSGNESFFMHLLRQHYQELSEGNKNDILTKILDYSENVIEDQTQDYSEEAKPKFPDDTIIEIVNNYLNIDNPTKIRWLFVLAQLKPTMVTIDFILQYEKLLTEQDKIQIFKNACSNRNPKLLPIILKKFPTLKQAELFKQTLRLIARMILPILLYVYLFLTYAYGRNVGAFLYVIYDLQPTISLQVESTTLLSRFTSALPISYRLAIGLGKLIILSSIYIILGIQLGLTSFLIQSCFLPLLLILFDSFLFNNIKTMHLLPLIKYQAVSYFQAAQNTLRSLKISVLDKIRPTNIITSPDVPSDILLARKNKYFTPHKDSQKNRPNNAENPNVPPIINLGVGTTPQL